LVASIGPASTLALPHEELGNNTAILQDIADQKHEFAEVLKIAKRTMIVLGMGALARKDSKSVLSAVHKIAANSPNMVNAALNWNGLNILHTAASRVAAQDLGFVWGGIRSAFVTPKVVYLMGADDQDVVNSIPQDAFVIYQGHHGDAGAARADVILPGASYTEKSGTYVNLEGRVQQTNKIQNLLHQAREDWQIVRALSEVLNVPLPYSQLSEVRARLADVSPTFAGSELEKPCMTQSFQQPAEPLKPSPFDPYYDNFYFTNVVSRSSKIMANASRELPNSRNSYKINQELIASRDDTEETGYKQQHA